MKSSWPGRIGLRRNNAAILFVLIASIAGADLFAQAKSTTEPDVVLFPNGEKLIGHFESFTGGTAKFMSETLGEVTVDLTKVKELHASEKFAVITKNLKLGKGKVDGQVPRGTIAVSNQKLEVTPGGGQPSRTLPLADLSDIIGEASFEEAFRHSGVFDKWKGGIVFGSSIVEATQNSLSFNTSASLVRAVPSENWLSPRNRTSLDFSDSYGKVTQPGSPQVKTSIFHADAERDEFLSERFFALAAPAFDHNFSQGLDLQQLYGGGFGWTAIKKANQALDFKASIDYEKQSFQTPASNKSLADSIFSETYSLKFSKGILLNEQLSANPSWSNTHSYSAYSAVGITLPVYKRLGFNANIVDSFLNDPPPGFKKNSFQFTTGLSFTLR